MLNDAVGFEKIFIATGYTDLRRGIDGLASTIKFQFDLDPFQKHILFLFCGKRTDRIKGLVWEGDGFLLLYKRLNIGGFSWPRTKEKAALNKRLVVYFIAAVRLLFFIKILAPMPFLRAESDTVNPRSNRRV